MTHAETTSATFAFDADGARLAGVIERPATGEPRGSILLLSGSGPQDRDEAIAGHRPFAVLSEALARVGFQVLRWDDRGVGDSEGDYQAISEETLIRDVDDAMSAVRRATGHARHVLIGHSQGALIGAAVAARSRDRVSGLVLLAGMMLPGREGLLQQHEAICRAEGWSEADIESSLAWKAALFDLLTSPRADDEATLRADLFAYVLDGHDLDALDAEERDETVAVVEDLLEWEWRFLLRADPADDLGQVACPVLAIFGDRDVQVDAARNLAALEQACRHRPDGSVEVHRLPDHNHLFQHTRAGAISDYERLGTPFTDACLAILHRWLDAMHR